MVPRDAPTSTAPQNDEKPPQTLERWTEPRTPTDRLTEANYSTFEAHYEARQPQEDRGPPQGGRVLGEAQPGSGARHPQEGKQGDQEGEDGGPVTIHGKPYDPGEWGKGS